MLIKDYVKFIHEKVSDFKCVCRTKIFTMQLGARSVI